MKIILVTLFLSLCAIVISTEPGPLFDMGSYSGKVNVGSRLSPKYIPLHSADVVATKNARPKLEAALHNKTITGAVDPFVKDQVGPIPPKNEPISGPTTLRDLKIEGLSALKLNNLEIRLNNKQQLGDPLRVDIDISVPNIEVNTDFSTTVKLFVFETPVNGHLRVILTGVHMALGLQVDLRKAGLLESRGLYEFVGAEANLKIDKVQLQLNLPEILQVQNDKNRVNRTYKKAREAFIKMIFEHFLLEASSILKDVPNDEIKRILYN